MLSSGRSELELDRWSYEKILLFYGLAQKRLRKESAAQDVRMIRCLRVAIAGAMSKKGGAIAEKYEAELLKQIKDGSEDPGQALQRFISQLPADMVKTE